MVDKNKTRAGGSFFPYLNITIFDLSKYGSLYLLVEMIINITVYTLLYSQEGYQILNYRS